MQLLFALFFSATLAAATHPLDPLSATEIATTVNVLQSAGKITARSRIPVLVLHEPPKSEVAAFVPGKSFRREAFAMIFERAARKTFEALVDLNARRLISWIDIKDVQPPLMIEDMAIAEQFVINDPQWRAAMNKRGITDISNVEVDAWSAGYHGHGDDLQSHRLICATPYLRDNTGTSFSRPVEGVVAFVDLTARKVRVVDTGVVPIPRDHARMKAVPNSLPPLSIAQPKGTGFSLKGQQVDWGNWQFRFAMHPREGLVLYTAGFRDHGSLRPILYRGSLSDMVVPYGDPAPDWFFRNIFDTGEYAWVGRSLIPLNSGVDVPPNAAFSDATFADDAGKPFRISRAAALYVRDGGLLWRYQDTTAESRAESRREQQLVLAWIISAGNYQYGFNWVFHEDGRLEMEVLLTGIMIAKAVGSFAGHEGMYGHRVSDHLVAVHHQHFFNFRLDMDVDGAHNSVVEMNTSGATIGPGDPYGKTMLMNETPLHTESEAKRLVDLAASRTWKVINPRRKNALGEPVGYMLIPGENALPYAAPGSWLRKRAGFLDAHLWVTPFAADEMNAAGNYVNQSHGGGLPEWTSRNRPIENRDIVLWYTLGVTHIPRPEEWPVMSVHRAGFQLVPAGFFSRNPTME